MEGLKRNPIREMRNFGRKCARVLRVARKPTSTEVKQVSKVSAIGLLIIGLLGFIVAMIFLFASSFKL